MISASAVKNVIAAGVGIIGGEFAGRSIVGKMPGPDWVTPAAMLLGGTYLGSRGGWLGKIGYGVGVAGVLHLANRFAPDYVDVDFGAF